MNPIRYTQDQLREAIELYVTFHDKKGYDHESAVETAVQDIESALATEIELIEDGICPVTTQYQELSWLKIMLERSVNDNRIISGAKGLGAAFLEHATAPPKKNGSA